MLNQPIGFHSNQYEITTDIYQGPLDLLLSLIERAELDITVLSIAQVTDQFLDYIRHMEEENLSEVSAFVAIASRLILIKSAALLPKSIVPSAEFEEDSGEALARQLIAYRRFKQIAEMLSAREDNALRTMLRLGTPDTGIETRIDFDGLCANDLADYASVLFAIRVPPAELSSVMKVPRITIRDKISLFVHELNTRHRLSFHSLLQSGSRSETVVTFLAMLELIKQNAIQITQDDLFSEIEISAAAEQLSETDFQTEFEE